MPLPSNSQFFDWLKQEWVTVHKPQQMLYEQARRYISQGHRAQHAYENYVKAGMTPYAAMLTVESNGGK